MTWLTLGVYLLWVGQSGGGLVVLLATLLGSLYSVFALAWNRSVTKPA
jgi:hypothetical protein